jgi:pimeloyl-ACP methyl ester carboxylesterase
MTREAAAGAPAGVAAAGVPRWADLGSPVHYLDFGGPDGAPVLVCVHGLGGSAVNWVSLAPLLTGSFRVLAPDLAGHGLTQAAGRGADVGANRALLAQFIGAVAGQPVMLAGNSMGGMIALQQAAAAPAAVSRLILLAPAVPFLLPDPVIAGMFAVNLIPGAGRFLQARRPRSPADVAAGILRLCCADPARVPPEVVERHLAVALERATLPTAEEDFAAAARSVLAALYSPQRRAYQRQIRSVRCPVLVIHGSRDRLVPVRAARAAARAAVRDGRPWTLAELPGVGHVPHLEAPGETAGVITGWLTEGPTRPGGPARRGGTRPSG